MYTVICLCCRAASYGHGQLNQSQTQASTVHAKGDRVPSRLLHRAAIRSQSRETHLEKGKLPMFLEKHSDPNEQRITLQTAA